MSKKQIERIRATLYNLEEARLSKDEAIDKIKDIIYNGKIKFNLDETRKRIKEYKDVICIVEGKEQKGMSSAAIPISKYINQVFDEEIAKITNKNITEICKKS